MPKLKKNKIKFVALPFPLLESKAYMALPPSAAKALPLFYKRVWRFFEDPLYCNDCITFTYKEANRVGFANGTFSQVIISLVRNGFIDPVERGGKRGFGYGESKFRLSRRWKEYGTPNFKSVEWLQTPPRINQSLRQKANVATPKYERIRQNNPGCSSEIDVVRTDSV